MELRVLQYFLAVANKGSISKAAEFLHITQPTLSRQIKDLEDELGKILFIRGSKKITLTDDGILLKKRAEEILKLVEKTKLEINNIDTNLNGDIYIGGGETEGMKIIAKAIHSLNKKYPDIKFHVFSGNAQDVTDKLEKGLLDFGLLIEPADISNYNFIKLPVTDTWGLLIRTDNKLADLEVITPNDIKDKPLICSRQDMVKNEISGWLGFDYDKLNIISTYNLIYNASLLVKEGVGHALCLDKLVDTYKNNALCFRPLEPKLEVNLVFVWKKNQILSSACDVFLKEMQEQILKLKK